VSWTRRLNSSGLSPGFRHLDLVAVPVSQPNWDCDCTKTAERIDVLFRVETPADPINTDFRHLDLVAVLVS